MKIRLENKNDFNAIKIVNDKAFGQPQEGNVINKLRGSDPQVLSFVAEINNQVVGHIFYSTAKIECDNKEIVGLGLAPMAVLPEYQKQGIGKMLMSSGIDFCKKNNKKTITLESSSKLENALNMYIKFGFKHMKFKETHFATADIKMKLKLK